MLNVIRENFKQSPYLKWVLLLVGLGLVAYLGNYFIEDQSAGGASSWVARVNGTEIPDWKLRESARNLDQYYRQMFGDSYEQIRERLPLRQQALQTLIERELILQDAYRLGLVGEDAAVAERIRTHPSLQTQEGTFIGKERYEQVIDRAYTGGVAAFERGLRNDLVVDQWTNLVSQAVRVSDGELEEVFRERTVKTEFDYVLALASEQTVSQDVSQEELAAWHASHSDDYKQREGRRIRFVTVERRAQMDKAEVTEEEIETYYTNNIERYSHPEQRSARHILFRVSEDTDAAKAAARTRAEAALARAQAGEEMAALAGELSEDTVSAERGGDLGFFTRGSMVGAFEDAVFATEVDEFAPITESPFGMHVIQVTGAREAGTSPLEEVRDAIEQTLKLRAAEDLVVAEAERIREAIATPDRFAEVTATEGLAVVDRVVRRGDTMRDIGASPDFLTAMLSGEIGTLSEPLRVAAGLALLIVDEEIPETISPLDEVIDDVRSAILTGRRSQAATGSAREAIERGSSIASIAASFGREVQSLGEVGPGQKIQGLSADEDELAEALFGDGVEVGSRGVIQGPEGAMVYEVTGRVPFDAARFESEKDSLRGEILQERRAGYLQSMLLTLRERQEVELNNARIDAVIPQG